MPADAVPCYDIAGNLLFQHSMDAGDRWMLMDAAGQPHARLGLQRAHGRDRAHGLQGAPPLRHALRRPASARSSAGCASATRAPAGRRGVARSSAFATAKACPNDNAQQPERPALAALRRQRPRADRCVRPLRQAARRRDGAWPATSRRRWSIGPVVQLDDIHVRRRAGFEPKSSPSAPSTTRSAA